MIVSWNWLKQYVDLSMPVEELEERLSLAGLNHEGTERVDGDLAIDLEVTSNRPDCLGHIGVAREIAVLWDQQLKVPEPRPKESGPAVGKLCDVRIDCPELCYRYTARVIRGVKIGPSPSWLADRLRTVGLAVINNVVDVTNYVMMECGQPLHAFDFANIAGGQIVVREGRPGETFTAIDHKTYELNADTCVIADAENAVALGGVMGGAESEVSDATTDLLIEAAEFDPLSIRTTARRLVLHSPSSYRFERGVDPAGVDWASRRACELILELAGGELAAGVADVGRDLVPPRPLVLRLAELERILGIRISHRESRRILTALGCREHAITTEELAEEVLGRIGVGLDLSESFCVTPPSWRRDLTREIDLVEEVGRIHGYDKVPEDIDVPMAASHRTDDDRVLEKIRRVLTAAGMDEAITTSVVSLEADAAYSPWVDAAPLQTSSPMLQGADRLRRSLLPSLLMARRENEKVGNARIELFETAKVYLPRPGQLPDEPTLVSCTSGGDFPAVKGVIETMVDTLCPGTRLEVELAADDLLAPGRACQLKLDGQTLGYLGEVSQAGLARFALRAPTTVAELRFDRLAAIAQLVPQQAELSSYPAITLDLNLIVDEAIRWSQIAETARRNGGDHLEALQYQETYRDPDKDGAGKKRLLFSVTLRSFDKTLTGAEAEAIRDQLVAACSEAHGAKLLG